MACKVKKENPRIFVHLSLLCRVPLEPSNRTSTSCVPIASHAASVLAASVLAASVHGACESRQASPGWVVTFMVYWI
ncbi:hypothetical protein V6N13_026788 [Hibiscus sabdariffa]